MRIFDTTGVQTVKYQLCSCSPSAPSAQQILEAGWLQTASQSEVCETWALRAQFEKLGAFALRYSTLHALTTQYTAA
jgi:hypothetical protein